MLDIDLVQGRPALKVVYRISMVDDLLHALGLVHSANELEGLDQWVYATHAALPQTLRRDLTVVLKVVQKSKVFDRWLKALAPDDPTWHSFVAFVTWLNGFGPDDFAALIDHFLEHFSDFCEAELGSDLVSPPDPAVLRECLARKFEGATLEQFVAVLQAPLAMKSLLISVLTRFWELFYRDEYARCRPLAEQSIDYHRGQSYGTDFASVFTSVTGRRVPREWQDLDDVANLVLIPSCHIGPYVGYSEEQEETAHKTLILHYNCRPTGGADREHTPVILNVFPPLKALADETRLQILSLLDGREMYAQEIVEHLDISQSAVSRHLKLMVTSELLTVRKQDSMKYYMVNEDTLQALAEHLRTFKGKK